MSSTTADTAPAVDMEKVHDFAMKIVGDLGATMTGALVHLGDRLGLYEALAQGPATSQELADRAGVAERYVREWLGNQTAAGYVGYDSATALFALPPEHAAVLANPDSPAFLVGGFEAAVASFHILDRMESAWRTGDGVGWSEHDRRLFHGVERFFRPSYRANLCTNWIPALDGVVDKLAQGGRVADVGCGHGASALVIAETFPTATVHGYDLHAESIDTANERAAAAGVAGRVRFAVASATDLPEEQYDLITFFDCLHDMGDPVAAAAHVRSRLRPDGTLLLVEPLAGDRLEDNLHPLGQAFYGFSSLICTPASIADGSGCTLGAQAGETRLREVLTKAGFTRIRRAAEAPTNLILEVRP
ncbi:MAG: class I SAM-dependent methyltransferase [Planctomycetota bacterium]